MARKVHYHVHSHLGNGYLCECDSHPALAAAERDAALRWERDAWRDYAAEGDGTVRIRGSVRAGHFEITDTAAVGWARYVDAWSCADPACYPCEWDATDAGECAFLRERSVAGKSDTIPACAQHDGTAVR